MNALSHTPGPWQIGAPSKTVGRVIWRNDPGPNPENTGWARIARNVENPADAALIAAAPELLDALKWALDLVPCGCQHETRVKNGGKDCAGGNGEPGCWRADLAIVIAKAEGGVK